MDSAQKSALSCLSCLGCWSQFKHEEQWALDDSRTKDFFASTNWNVSLYDMAVNLDSERHLFWDQPVMCRMCLSEWNFTICEWASISVYLSFRRTTSFFASMRELQILRWVRGDGWAQYEKHLMFYYVSVYLTPLSKQCAAVGVSPVEFGPKSVEAGHARAAGPPFGAVAQCSTASLWCCDAVRTATSLEDAGSGKGSYSFFSSWFLQGAYHHT